MCSRSAAVVAPPFFPASRASSDVNRCASPTACAAHRPLERSPDALPCPAPRTLDAAWLASARLRPSPVGPPFSLVWANSNVFFPSLVCAVHGSLLGWVSARTDSGGVGGVAAVAALSLPCGLRVAGFFVRGGYFVRVRPTSGFSRRSVSIDAPIYFGAQGPQLVAGAIDLVEESQGLRLRSVVVMPQLLDAVRGHMQSS